jgi:hypothetical protein
MKLKPITISIIILFRVTLVYGQASSPAQDAFPDTTVINDLQKLLPATGTDTALNRLSIVINGQKVNFGLYHLVKTYKNAAGFSGQQAVQVKNIVSLSKNYKKVLDLIDKLRTQAIYLSKNDFDFRDGLDPLQNKIAYSWGSKDFSPRLKPPGTGDYCDYKIHGLDCSGFIYQLFLRNNIQLPIARCNAETERHPDFLISYLANYLGINNFNVVDLGKLTFDQLQSGDIVYFTGKDGIAFHIAIVFVNEDGQIALFQSLGNPYRKQTDIDWCSINIDQNHGVVAKILDGRIERRSYGCIRIIAR